MCYIVRQMNATHQVGIRELRQNLSVYLRRLKDGERFEVTDRGQPVGLLIPLSEDKSATDRLVAAGLASPPSADLTELGLPPRHAEVELSASLEWVRRELT